MKGQDDVKRALLIAAAGSHNVLMIGPPGTGKTLLAKRLPTIMPPLTPAESLETTRIYSAMGLLPAGEPLMARRPFRSPHHSVSDAGLVGGGSPPQPGRDQPGAQGGAVPRRAARVQPQDARGPPPAARGGRGDDQPRALLDHLPRRVHHGRGDESLPLRLSLRPPPRLQLHAAAGRALPEQDLGPLARPDRPPRRGPVGPVHPAGRGAPRPDLGRLAAPRYSRPGLARPSGSVPRGRASTAG